MTTQIKGRAKKLLYLLLFFVLCCGLAQGYKEFNIYSQREEMKKNTTPLPQNKIDVLCKNLGLNKSHALCNGNKDIYGSDFYRLIFDTFKPELTYRATNDIPASYEQVERTIGEFKVGCGQKEWLKFEQRYVYECRYDLRGDGKYFISIIYYEPGGIVYDVIAPIGKEPHDR